MSAVSSDGWVRRPVRPEDDVAAEAAIRHHVLRAMIGGSIPLPLVDLLAVTGVQLAMIEQLASIYGAPLDTRSTRALVGAAVPALMSGMAGRAAASAAKLVPLVGWIGGGAAQLIATGATTYSMGQVVMRLFRERRSLDELDAATLVEELRVQVDRGRELAQTLYRELQRTRHR